MAAKYDIGTLKRMISMYDRNIEMFSKYNDVEPQMATMVANRRLIASFIENDGVSTVPSDFRNKNVFFDTMLYTGNLPNADTSWWTRGT